MTKLPIALGILAIIGLPATAVAQAPSRATEKVFIRAIA